MSLVIPQNFLKSESADGETLSTVRVAVLDDDRNDFFTISDGITSLGGADFKVDWIRNYQSALDKLQSGEYHLFFVDYFLGTRTGLDFLKDASTVEGACPIVLMTSFGSELIDATALKSGAADYLVKSEITADKLERCVHHALERYNFVEEVRNRDARLRKLLEISREPVFIADRELSLLELNPAATSIFVDGERGTPLSFETFLEDEKDRIYIQKRLDAEREVSNWPVRIRTAAGVLRSFRLSLHVEPAGAETIIYGTLQETDQQKETFSQLQSEKMVSYERLIKTLTHKIRNPLNNIVLSVDQVNVGGVNDEQKLFLDIIRRNALRINELVSELVDMAAPSRLSFSPVDMARLVEESLDNAKEKTGSLKVGVEVLRPDDLPLVMGDHERLLTAFTNIFVNALEVVNQETGKLQVSFKASENDLSISIRDNGTGIPQEHLTSLFDPFFTLKHNGTGLGLTAAYSIIQAHSGSIEVESHEGDGTEFRVTLPVKQAGLRDTGK